MVLGGLADDDDFAGGVGEDVIGGVAEVDGGAGSADEGGLLAASAVDGVGVGNAEHDEVDVLGGGDIDDGRTGVAGLEEDGLAGDLGLFGSGFGVGEAGFALGGFLRQVAIDGMGAVDFDDVDRQDAGFAPVDAGEVQGDIEAAPRLGRAVEGNEDGDGSHVRSVFAGGGSRVRGRLVGVLGLLADDVGAVFVELFEPGVEASVVDFDEAQGAESGVEVARVHGAAGVDQEDAADGLD